MKETIKMHNFLFTLIFLKIINFFKDLKYYFFFNKIKPFFKKIFIKIFFKIFILLITYYYPLIVAI